MTSALLCASPMADTAMSAPLFVASPMAKTPSIFVLKVASSALIVPLEVSSSPSKPERSDFCPIAIITLSSSIFSNSPSTGTGFLLPLSSGSPSSMTCSLMPQTLPLSPRISSGLVRNLKVTPSSSASSISRLSAGISSRVRRYIT